MKTGLSFESPVLDFGCLGAARVPVRRLPPPPGTRPRTEIAAIRAQRAGHRVNHPGQERLLFGPPSPCRREDGLKIHHLPTPRPGSSSTRTPTTTSSARPTTDPEGGSVPPHALKPAKTKTPYAHACHRTERIVERGPQHCAAPRARSPSSSPDGIRPPLPTSASNILCPTNIQTADRL